MSRSIDALLDISPVIPVLVIDNPDDAVPLAQALYDGGLRVLEVTLRTAAALESVSLIKKALPDLYVGTGSVINHSLFQASVEVGADFVVSPGYSRLLDGLASENDMPFLPGVSTPGEVMQLLEQGISTMKFFPAEVAGGTAMLKAIAGPMSAAKFCPTGGVNPNNVGNYLGLSNVLCVGGSWLAPKSLMEQKAWGEIESLAAEAASLGR